jgi:maleylpyruvate isomerase
MLGQARTTPVSRRPRAAPRQGRPARCSRPGREGSRHGLEEFTEVKYVCIAVAKSAWTAMQDEHKQTGGDGRRIDMAAPSEPLQLFGFWRSLATYRVRIGLRLKGFDWTEEMVDLLKGEQYDASFGAHNPQQRLPVLLLDEGRALAQSLAILEYLEEVRPEPALWPENCYRRARARQFALISIADCHPLIVPRVRGYLAETFGADDAAIEAWGRHWMDQGLRAMQALLARPERPQGAFCYGNTPGIADIALASHCAGAGYFNCPLDPYADVQAILERCMALPAFSETHPLVIKAATGADSP